MYKDGSHEAPNPVMSPTYPVCSKSVHRNLGHASSRTLNYKYVEKLTPCYLEGEHIRRNTVSLSGGEKLKGT